MTTNKSKFLLLVHKHPEIEKWRSALGLSDEWKILALGAPLVGYRFEKIVIAPIRKEDISANDLVWIRRYEGAARLKLGHGFTENFFWL